jgi:hypothetical protein
MFLYRCDECGNEIPGEEPVLEVSLTLRSGRDIESTKRKTVAADLCGAQCFKNWLMHSEARRADMLRAVGFEP